MSESPYGNWEAVIGLEIHVQLNTKSKLFSSAPNSFGDEPNTNITEVCTGQPGALPVLNKEAVQKAILLGHGLGAKVSLVSSFDRKSYFYPDSPRNFQITQFSHPIIKGGAVSAEVDGKIKEFTITHAHLEDDAGMLKHFSSFAGVDYNRAGVPLIEIVSDPCMHTPQDASAYARAIRSILQFLEVSDCNMEEGSLRFDANTSVRKIGEKGLREKSEIKNMNSFHFLELAIDAEIRRQIKHYEKNPDEPIIAGTYRWDPEKKQTFLMRRKETADDYRYFPEPDLPPLVLTQEQIDEVKKSLPELPQQRFTRYVEELELSEYNAAVLTSEKKLSDYFEQACCFHQNPKIICTWITIEFAGRLKESGSTLTTLGIPPEHIAKLVKLIDDKVITSRIAKAVADDMVSKPGVDPEQIVKENPDYQPMSDTSSIDPIVEEVLNNNPQSIEDYKAGKTKAFAFLVGQVMKQTRGKASPDVVNQLIHKRLDAKK